jgi:hypothetical protein
VIASFFRREQDPAQTPPGPPDEDSPEALRQTLWQDVRLINASAGRLPGESVVAALRVTDAVREVIDTAAERPLDIHAVVSVKGILNDYLPTTLHTYLNLDPALIDTALPSGRTPKAALLEQIDSLWLAASDVLAATHAQDVNALMTQGSFLRTKFTGSDLDL